MDRESKEVISRFQRQWCAAGPAEGGRGAVSLLVCVQSSDAALRQGEGKPVDSVCTQWPSWQRARGNLLLQLPRTAFPLHAEP